MDQASVRRNIFDVAPLSQSRAPFRGSLRSKEILHRVDPRPSSTGTALRHSLRDTIRAELATTWLSFTIAAINTVISIYACIIYVVETYYPYDYSAYGTYFWVSDVSVCVYFFLDLVFFFWISEDMVDHLKEVSTWIDALTIVPIISAFAVDNVQFLGIFRAFRIARIARVTQYYQSRVGRALLMFILSVCFYIFIATGIFQSIGSYSSDTYVAFNAPLPWQDALYFSIVSFSTCGYGDITPVATVPMMVDTGLLLISLMLLPGVAREIYVLFSSISQFDGSAVIPRKYSGVLVCGNYHCLQLQRIIDQFFQDVRGNSMIKLIFMFPDEPDEHIRDLLQNPKYESRIQYLKGQVSQYSDFVRTSPVSLLAAFVLSDLSAGNAEEEDAVAIFRTLSIKQHNPNLRCIVQLLRLESVKELGSLADVDVLCLDELRYGLFSHSTSVHGLSALCLNIVNHWACREHVFDFESSPWLEEYVNGMQHGLYFIPISCNVFNGLTFSEMACLLYKQHGIVAVAVESTVYDTEGSFAANNRFVFLNPGASHFMSLGDSIYVLAKSMSHARTIEALLLSSDRASTAKDCEIAATSTPAPILVTFQRQLDHIAKISKDIYTATAGVDADVVGGFKDLCAELTQTFRRVKSQRQTDVRSNADGVRTCDSNDELVLGGHKELEPNSIRDGFCSELLNKDCQSFSGHIICCGATLAAAKLIHRLRYYSRVTTVVVILTMDNIALLSDEVCRQLGSVPDVAIVQGTPLKASDLLDAGVAGAASVVILSGHSPTTSDSYETVVGLDAETVLATLNILSLNPTAFTISELFDCRSADYLDISFLYPNVVSNHENNHKNAIVALPYDKSIDVNNNISNFNALVVSGRVFSVGILDVVAVETFFQPTAADILTHFLRLPVSGSLFNESDDDDDTKVIRNSNVLTIGLHRVPGWLCVPMAWQATLSPSNWKHEEHLRQQSIVLKRVEPKASNEVDATRLEGLGQGLFEALFQTYSQKGAVVMGLYRHQGAKCCPGSYVVTSPAPNDFVYHGDSVFILAPQGFRLL